MTSLITPVPYPGGRQLIADPGACPTKDARVTCPECFLPHPAGECDGGRATPVWRPRTPGRPVSLDPTGAVYHTPAAVRPQDRGNPCRVPSCGRLAGDGYVCSQCVEEWETCLANVPALVEDLGIAERRQARFSNGGARGIGDARPMPVERQAAYYTHRLRGELVGQIRIMCDTHHAQVPALGADTVAMSRWLLGWAARLPLMDDGAGLVADLAQMVADCLQVIDAPRRRAYVTGCSCGLAVFAPPDQPTVRCTCGAEYDVAAERESRMRVAEDYLMTVTEVAALAGIPRNTLRSWIRRGKLAVRGAHEGQDLVRFGDALGIGGEVA